MPYIVPKKQVPLVRRLPTDSEKLQQIKVLAMDVSTNLDGSRYFKKGRLR
jgi:hypothetical protein